MTSEPSAFGPDGMLRDGRAWTSLHKGVFGDIAIDYAATVEELILTDPEGQAMGSLFTTAYVREGQAAAGRPVVFAFNGGPGSSAIWLHLGALGPFRIDMDDDLDLGAAPARPVKPNVHSLLDAADVVLIDPVGTGFGRLARGQAPRAVYDVEADARYFAAVVRRWLRRHRRELSPKYILGESYGSIRAVVLAQRLTGADGELFQPVALDGIILVSQALDLSAKGAVVGPAIALPTMAATAWLHGRIQGCDLESVVEAARVFARETYVPALFAGSTLPKAQRETIAARLAELTGVPAGYFLARDLTIAKEAFTTELLRDVDRVMGRTDTRRTLPRPMTPISTKENDAAYNGDTPAFTASAPGYFRDRLKVDLDLEYVLSSSDIYRDWRYNDGVGPFPDYDYTKHLADVLARNGRTRAFIATGFCDLTTTVGAAEYLKSRLRPDAAGRTELAHYVGGHMLYTHEPSLAAFAADLRRFVGGV